MTTTMRVYVGTYHKYASGSIAGKWLDIEDYSDRSEFYDACRELHSDEEDPEFMLQDWEGIPKGMVGESFIEEEVFELAAMSEDDLELLTIYRDNIDESGDLAQAKDEFRGTANSKADYAQEFHEECGDMRDVPSWCVNYIDWESIARDMEYNGVSFIYENGTYWVFG